MVIPSIKTLSPTLNGGVEYPNIGVVIKQVKIPPEDDNTLCILTPLVLFTAANFTVVDGNPLGFCVISTEEMVLSAIFASNTPLSIFLPVRVSTITIDGGFM